MNRIIKISMENFDNNAMSKTTGNYSTITGIEENLDNFQSSFVIILNTRDQKLDMILLVSDQWAANE